MIWAEGKGDRHTEKNYYNRDNTSLYCHVLYSVQNY